MNPKLHPEPHPSANAIPTAPICPVHTGGTAAHAVAPNAPPPPAGPWPPGPRVFTGWGLLTQMARDPLGAFARWQHQYGDVVHLHIWPEHQVVVTDPDLARELLVTHHDSLVRWERGVRVFAQVHGGSVLVAEGSPWQHKRRALQPAFTPKAVAAFAPSITAAATQALRQWPQQAPHWPIESALTALAMEVILRLLFSASLGPEARSAEQAVHNLGVVANGELYWPVSWPDAMPWKRAKRAALATLNGLVARHLQARLTMPTDLWPGDLLARLLLLHFQDPQAWPLRAVHDECMTAFLAGHETLAATLTWWAWCMAAHPMAQHSVAAEVHRVLQGRAPEASDLEHLPLLNATLQETLRLYPAAPLLMTRRSTAPVQLGPWRLPAGTMFTLPVQRLHHDARWFPDPLVFRPERFAPDAPPPPRGAFMPFGTGPRVCLGQHLAQTEMRLVAALLLQHHTLVVPPGQAAPEPVLNVTLRPRVPLQLAILPAPGG